MRIYKTLIIVLLCEILFIQILNSQNLTDNLNKYWYYRHRLHAEFMLTEGDGSLQGTYMFVKF